MATPSNPVPDPLAEALRENQELRRSLAELRNAFQSAEQRSQEQLTAAASASEQLQQFVYAASHDLQEPLRAIMTYSQLLDRKFAGDAEAKEYTSFVLSGATRMRELLQHLLSYSRAGSSSRRAMFSLDLPLQRAIVKLGPEISATAAAIVRHPLPEAVADEAELAQVFEQILRNALKFRSEQAPHIEIGAEEMADEIVVILRDNGVGIAPRFAEQVLLPFKRLHGKEVPGSGLGLAICQKILRAHNGRIWIESDGSNGSTIRFSLPR